MEYRIDKVEIKATWDEQSRNGNVEATVWIDGVKKDGTATGFPGLYLTEVDQTVLCAWMTGRDGQEVDRIFPLPLEEEMQFCMRVEEPVLWNAEDPYCYQLILEIVDGESVCIDRRIEPVTFYGWKIMDGQTCMNEKAVSFRAVDFPEGTRSEEEIRQFLQKMKQEYYNTLLIKGGERTPSLVKWCMEYGIYLLEEGKDADAGWLRARLDLDGKSEQNPDFHLQVVQTGALIENRSTFVNASEYDLHCQILNHLGEKVFENRLSTDIPAGTSKFVDIPFMRPVEPGTYRYRVALCLKRDTPWAPKGYEIAAGETVISNIYER